MRALIVVGIARDARAVPVPGDAVGEVAIAGTHGDHFPDVKSRSVELESHQEVPNDVLAVARLADLHHQVDARERHRGRATWQAPGAGCERMGP